MQWEYSVPGFLKRAYKEKDDTRAITAMLRVMVLHGGPPESLTAELMPRLQQIVQDGARLRARLPAYLAERRTLLDAHCPLLPPLLDLVRGYEERAHHHRRDLGDGAWGTPVTRETLQARERPAHLAPLCAPASEPPVISFGFDGSCNIFSLINTTSCERVSSLAARLHGAHHRREALGHVAEYGPVWHEARLAPPDAVQ
jgi:hypothetical protein